MLKLKKSIQNFTNRHEKESFSLAMKRWQFQMALGTINNNLDLLFVSRTKPLKIFVENTMNLTNEKDLCIKIRRRRDKRSEGSCSICK